MALLGVVFAGLIQAADPAEAATLDVCPSGCSYSLIQNALDDAASGDIISVGPGTYSENLSISTSVSIVGSSQASTAIDGGAAGRVIAVASGVDVTITDVTITNGLVTFSGLPSPNGGGIFNEGSLTLERVEVVSNTAADGGGGIYNTGTLAVADSVVSQNTGMTDGTGGIGGGGIASTSPSASVTITRSMIAGNTLVKPGTDQRGGGGVASKAGSDLTITDSVIADNDSGYSAGGIYVDGSGSEFTLSRSTLSGNRTGTDQGFGRGAGLAIRRSAVGTIVDSTITGNISATSGGGIQVDASLTIENSTISGNQAASHGGGIDVDSSVDLSSVTVVDNVAGTFGGGVFGFETTIFSSNSIIANNSAGDTGADCYTTVSISDVSLIETTDATICMVSGAGTLITGTDPQLGPLQDNGGPTETHVPAQGSPVLDAGSTTLTFDQRGEPRPAGSAPDIGSVELQIGPSPVLELLPDWAGFDTWILARSLPVDGADCGWAAGETVEVLWNDTVPLRTLTADSNGCFEEPVFLAGDEQLSGASFGTHKIVARGQTSGTAAQAAFELVEQQLHVMPLAVGPGSPVALTGCGWSGAPTVNVYWLATGDLVGKANVDAGGCIDATGTIPRASEGYYTLGATTQATAPDGPGGTSASLIAVENAFFDMTPTQGPPGQDVDLEGCSWYPGETVSFTWLSTGELLDEFPVGPDGCLTSVVTGPQGRPLIFVEVPLSAPEGDHVIRAEGGTSPQRVDRTFTVTEPGLILDPIEGPPDTTVSATGCGWGENDWVDLTWQAQQAGGQSGDYPYLGRASVDQTTGCFGEGGTFTFQVPDDTVANESVQVIAEGNSIRQAEAEFFVIHDGSITIPDSDVSVGQIVSVQIDGAIIGESINFIWDDTDVIAGVGAATTDFLFDLQVPIDAKVGNHSIRAEGTRGFDDVEPITVIDDAAITSPTSQPLVPGNEVTIEGTGFAAGDEINFWVRDPDSGSGPYLGQFQMPTDQTSFTTRLTLPMNAPVGDSVIAAVGDLGHTAYLEVSVAQLPFTLTAIEVTQAVQTLVNEVDLFERKRTVVRVYLDDVTGASDRYTGTLEVYRNGVWVDSLDPVNGTIKAPVDSVARRYAPDSTLNFVVPYSLTSEGTVAFSFELGQDHPNGVDCAEYGDSSPDCAVLVDFLPSTPSYLDFYAVPYWTDEIVNLEFTPDPDQEPGGSFTLTVGQETTEPIVEFSKAAIRDAIVALDGFADGEVVVSGIREGSRLGGGGGRLAEGQIGFRVSIRQRQNIPAITADVSSLTDSTLMLRSVQQGGTFRSPTLAQMMEQYLRIESTMPTGDITPRFYTADTLDYTPTTDNVNKRVLVPIRTTIDGTCSDCLPPETRLVGLMRESHPYSSSIGNSQGLTLAAFDVGREGKGDNGYSRNNAPHEVYHSYGKEHAVVQQVDTDDDDVEDETVGLCGSWGPLSGLLHPDVEEIPGKKNPGLDLDGYSDETWPTLGPLLNGVEHEVWGFDTRFAGQDLNGLAVSSPYQTAALMSYCGGAGSSQEMWPSAFGYLEVAKGLELGRIGTEEDPGYVGNVLFVSGTVEDDGSALIDPILATQGELPAVDTDPTPEPDSVEVTLYTSDGTEISSRIVSLYSADHPNVLPADDPVSEERGGPGFAVGLPDPQQLGAVLEVRSNEDGVLLGAAHASQTAPEVTLTSPDADGFGSSGSLDVGWESSDSDGDPLSASIFFSSDDGQTWRPLAIGIGDSALPIDRSRLEATQTGRIKVVVSDGFRSAEDISEAFVVTGEGPVVVILSPTANSVPADAPVSFEAVAWDREDGLIDPASAEWSSDLAGSLGTGSPLTLEAGVLARGCHLLTASFVDSDGSRGFEKQALGVGDECSPEDTAGTVRIVEISSSEDRFGYSSDLPGASRFDLADGEILEVGAPAGQYVVVQDSDPSFRVTVDCVDPSGGSRAHSASGVAEVDVDPGEVVECTFENRRINTPPSVEAASATVQYSDSVEPIQVSVSDPDSAPSSITLEASGLPDGLLLGPLSCVEAGDGSSCLASITGSATASPGDFEVTLTASDGIASETVSIEMSVLPEDASLRFHGGNPVAVPVADDTSGPFEMMLRVTERLPDAAEGDPAPGDLRRARVTITLEPIGPGGEIGVISPCERRLDGIGYDQELTVTCSFEHVPVGAYAVVATVGDAYMAAGEEVVVVYDPSSSYVQGAGTFVWPGTDDIVRVGFSMEYNKKGKNVKGGLMLVRVTPDGATYAVKSNALYGLALSKPSDPIGWAAFAGKATYRSPEMEDPEGNHEFGVYSDTDDRFWIEIRDKDGQVISESSMQRPGPDHAVTFLEGEVVIPHGADTTDRID